MPTYIIETVDSVPEHSGFVVSVNRELRCGCDLSSLSMHVIDDQLVSECANCGAGWWVNKVSVVRATSQAEYALAVPSLGIPSLDRNV